jgi:hypothetical protein
VPSIRDRWSSRLTEAAAGGESTAWWHVTLPPMWARVLIAAGASPARTGKADQWVGGAEAHEPSTVATDRVRTAEPDELEHPAAPQSRVSPAPSKKLLVAGVCSAIAATVTLVVVLISELRFSSLSPGPNGMPPPPESNTDVVVLFILLTGLCVLSWLTALIVWLRDQIFERVGDASRAETLPVKTNERGESWEEYGERRETDGYLNGLRAVNLGEQSPRTVQAIRRTPPAN